MHPTRSLRRKAIVRPGRHPTVPSTLIAGIEYSERTFSNQSAQRVSIVRPGSRMRCRVVTPPTVGSRKGLTSSRRVPGVHRVSESTRTQISPRDSPTPRRSALRLPAVSVQHHCTQKSAQIFSSTTLRGPLMTTMTSVGRCSTIRARTSRKRSWSSSTTGMMIELVTFHGNCAGQ